MSDYPNSGILNGNKWKRAGSKMPDLTGKAAVTCVHCQQETEFELAAWIRTKGNGATFTTVMFTEKSEAERKKAERAAAKAGLPVAEAESREPKVEGREEAPENKIPF